MFFRNFLKICRIRSSCLSVTTGGVVLVGAAGILASEATTTTTTSTTTYSESAQNEKTKQADDDEVFQGSCLKRQMFRPNVPYPAWDYNWDGRMTSESTLEAQSTVEGFHKSKEGTTRHIILVRHGQYAMIGNSLLDGDQDDARVLTPLGRRQAELTGQRLALLARGGLGNNYGVLGDEKNYIGPCNIKAIHQSDLRRAKETAEIIASHLKKPHNVVLTAPDPMLNEVLPAQIIPSRPDLKPKHIEMIEDNKENVERAFRKYFYRALPEDYKAPPPHEFEIIVCHANVIRYFLCRALQLPPEAWLRMSLFNCSISYIMIQPNGSVSARLIGDTGHIPYEDTTFSESHGYNWHSLH